MKKLRFIGIAAGLAGAVTAGLVLLAPATHGQTVRIVSTDDDPQVRALEILGGRGSQIGLTVRDADTADAKREKLPAPSGAVVDEVRSGSAAEKAGFKAGDVVVSLDGERVRSARQFARLVEETPAGHSVKATVVRDGRQVELEVTPDRHSGLALAGPHGLAWRGEVVSPELGRGLDHLHRDLEPLRRAPGFRLDPETFDFRWMARQGRLGVSVLDLSPELARHFGADQGVLVNSVEPDSPAARAGVEVGDIITKVDGDPVEDRGELMRKLWRDEDKQAVTLEIVRDGKATSVEVDLDRPAARPPASRLPV